MRHFKRTPNREAPPGGGGGTHQNTHPESARLQHDSQCTLTLASSLTASSTKQHDTPPKVKESNQTPRKVSGVVSASRIPRVTRQSSNSAVGKELPT
ncbi:hypothetical protein E2C01_099159 [Portunus trituberculatus]|uniref:Uncharacterized protein n=1 Tax=Portunus trituberculatus TaxID=210409 RepID=A0A5B7KE63_PORTR|nr:hypothetical protein [Portunus trituberculatus]